MSALATTLAASTFKEEEALVTSDLSLVGVLETLRQTARPSLTRFSLAEF
jgi:hypothetical protein